MTSVRVIRRYCKGCGLCVAFCEQGVLSMSDKVGPKGFKNVEVTYPGECTGCGRCALMCPDAAIEIVSGQGCPA